MVLETEGSYEFSLTESVSFTLPIVEEMVMRSYGYTGKAFERVNDKDLDTGFQDAKSRIDRTVAKRPIDPDEALIVRQMIEESFDRIIDHTVISEPIVYVGTLVGQPSIVLPYTSIVRHIPTEQSVELLASKSWSLSANPDIFEHSIDSLRRLMNQMKLPQIWGNKYPEYRHVVAFSIGQALVRIFDRGSVVHREKVIRTLGNISGVTCSLHFVRGLASGLPNMLQHRDISADLQAGIREWFESVFVDLIDDGKAIYFGDGWLPTEILYEIELSELYQYLLSQKDFHSLAIVTNALLETFYQNANTTKRNDLITYIRDFPPDIAQSEFEKNYYSQRKIN